jgi:hypothetical protein
LMATPTKTEAEENYSRHKPQVQSIAESAWDTSIHD